MAGFLSACSSIPTASPAASRLSAAAPSGAISADHTLTTFLCHAVAANRSEQKTLTLVVPDFLALQPAFFCDLADAWRSLRDKLSLGPDTRLRVDCCRDEASMNWLARWQHRIDLLRSRRAFARRNLDDVISVTRCLLVGRPDSEGEAIVLAIADPNVPLPDWAKPARMSLPGKR